MSVFMNCDMFLRTHISSTSAQTQTGTLPRSLEQSQENSRMTQARVDAENANYEVVNDATVEATLLNSNGKTPVDLLLEYEVSRPSAGLLQLTDICVRGSASACTAEDGLPTFAALAKAATGLCQFSQVPALEAMAAELVLSVKVNSLVTVRSPSPCRLI